MAMSPPTVVEHPELEAGNWSLMVSSPTPWVALRDGNRG